MARQDEGARAVPGKPRTKRSAGSQPASPDQPTAETAETPGTEAAEETPARLPTALIYDDAFLDHHVPRGFPEVPVRLEASIKTIEALIAQGDLPAKQVLRLLPRPATEDELTAAHERWYVERVRHAVEAAMEGMEGTGYESRPRKLATEVYVSPGSWRAATLAAGAPLVALDAIGEGRARNGYALVRPPGHHASAHQAMGFCVFNNVAVAARYAQRRWGWRRVLIVDYDVHHGNGTQDIFWEDGDVCYFSTHQFPWYPGTGASSERGAGAGLGATVNVPLPAGSGWSVYDPIFRQVLWPVADRFKPDVILLSAGFDAHWQDPLGEMRLSTAAYADLSLHVCELADTYCNGRLVAVQEGGYNIEAMRQCAATLLFALTGSDRVVDDLGEAPPMEFRWNEEAIVAALYELHDLAGYRRKPRPPQVREGWGT
jgi:acetoin utilization deacetylase AcuC-like enzyme